MDLLRLFHVRLGRIHLASQPTQLGHVSIARGHTVIELQFVLKYQIRWRPENYQLKWFIVCGSIHLGIVFVS